jgi:hypothetical protein
MVQRTIFYGVPDWHGIEFIHLPSYRRSAEALIDDEEQRTLEERLVHDPEAGPVMPGTGGVRKLRVAMPGRGRRGSARVIYYYRRSAQRIYLIVAYAKGRKDDLTPAECATMRRLTTLLEGET